MYRRDCSAVPGMRYNAVFCNSNSHSLSIGKTKAYRYLENVLSLLCFLQADIDSGESISNATVEAMSPATDSDPVTSAAQSTVALPQDPGVSITKVLSTSTTHLGLDQTLADVGDALVYTLTVENIGNTWLSAVSVDDLGLGDVTCSPDLSDLSSRLVVGAEIVCTGSVSLDQLMINAGFFESESTVSAPCAL